MNPNLTGHFHSHITTTSEPPSNIGGKITVIEIEKDGQKQRDVMLTHHYVTGHKGLESAKDVLRLMRSHAEDLRKRGLEVTREKLEWEIPEEYDSLAKDFPYVEVHVKCDISTDDRQELMEKSRDLGWHPSRNIYDRPARGTVTQFVNRRWYLETASKKISHIRQETCRLVSSLSSPKVRVKDVKYEAALFDTNEDLDRWWMCDHCAGC